MSRIVLYLIFILIAAGPSCKETVLKDILKGSPPGDNDCGDHVLKEPYILFQGDPTGMAVIIQTTAYIREYGDVLISWGTDDNNRGDYQSMDSYNCRVGGGCLDYCIWVKSWGHGTFPPNTKIYYKVHVRLPHQDSFFPGSFYTSDDNMNTLTFYAFGDTRDGDENYASVMNSIAIDMDGNIDERYRLLIHTGDIVFNGPWRRYEPANANWNTHFFGRNCNNNGGDRSKALWILSHVPVMTTLGNHDWEWDGHSDENSARFYMTNWPYWMYSYTNKITLSKLCDNQDYAPSPDSLYYSFNYGPAHFISLSTYPEDGDQSKKLGVGSEQYNWLERDLMNNNKPWTFVFCHIPFYDGGGAYNKTAIQSCEPLFQKYGVDAVLQGHQHCYVRINVNKGTPNEIPYITLGGGVKPDTSNKHYFADCYAYKYHFGRFEITNNDSVKVYITERHLNQPGNIEIFYIKNRPKQ